MSSKGHDKAFHLEERLERKFERYFEPPTEADTECCSRGGNRRRPCHRFVTDAAVWVNTRSARDERESGCPFS
jgi:hypothetical protein